MARAPAAWTRTPLQTLSTAPTRAPRLPADRRPAYRPKITPTKRKKVKPRRVPPRAPDRIDRTSAAAVDRFKSSPRYLDALAAAHLAREAQESKARLAKRGDYRPKLLGVVPLGKEKPREVFADRGRVRIRGKDVLGRNALRTEGKSTLELAELAEMLKKAERSKNPTKIAADFRRYKGESKQAGNPLHEPGLKLLDYAVRPTYASAGAASALVRGKGPKEAAKAAKKGIQGKEKKTYSTVLNEAGIKGGLASTVGFGLDVALDPTTYVSFGAASVARKSAAKSALEAAKAAEQAALRAGATRAQAKLRGIEARNATRAKVLKAKRASAPASHHETGLQLRLAGKAVPGVERATGAARHHARRGVQATVRRVPERPRAAAGKLRIFAREAAADANANLRRVDPVTKRVQTQESQTTEKALRRETRAEAQQTTRDLHERVNAMRGYVSKGEMRQVIDAIEAGDLKSLRDAPALQRRAIKRVRTRGMHKDPERLVVAAKNIQADLKYLNRIGRHSGAISGRVGKKGRSLQEVRQADIDTGAISSAKTRDALATARAEQAQARIALRNSTPSQRLAARRRVTETQGRVEFLRKRLLSQQRRQIDRQSASNVQRVGRQIRRKTEARGYFPRVEKDEIEGGGLLDRLSSLHSGNDVPYAQVGSNRPNVAAGQRREYRQSRADLRSDPKTKYVPEKLSEDIRPVLSQYAASVAKGSAAANLNTKIVQQLGRKLPKNPSREQLHALGEQGVGVFRVRRGILEELDPARHYGLIVNASKRSRTPSLTAKEIENANLPLHDRKPPRESGGGQVVLLDKAQLGRVRKREARPFADSKLVAGYDTGLRGWKTAALSTVGYLTRNLFGDSYNAWTDERGWRLIRNQARSSRVLGDLSRQERALRRFKREIPESKRTVKLSDEQAHEIAAHLKIPADQVSRKVKAEAIAKLAEDMGVIRQGRFVELMEDANVKPRGSNAWKDVSKRVEDQTRLATFLGGLQRGMNPRDAADRASKIHFDYGDLSDIEREAFRRVAPFYTFPARNVPHQAKTLVRRPGKFPVVAKLVEEGRRAAGLSEDYGEGLNPYEQRQMGVPIKLGDKTYTISLGLPFTDLNDVIAVGSGVVSGVAGLAGIDVGGEGFTGAGKAALQRAGEAAAPFPKTGLELLANHSLFYRDEISPEKEPFTRAPGWAIQAGQRSEKVRKALGLVDDYLPPDAPGKVWGWPRKMDYAFRQGQPGPINPLLDVIGLGVKGANARQMTKAQRLLAFSGLRAIKYESDPAKLNVLYDRREAVQTELDKLGRRAGADPTRRGTSSNVTADGQRLTDELSAIETQIDELLPKTRPGGLIGNERVQQGPALKALGALRVKEGPKLRTGANGVLKVKAEPKLR